MPDAVVASVGPLARIDGVRGVVHAVFPAAVYVEPSVGPLLVVHGPGHGHTPTSLIVPGTHAAGWGASAGDAVNGRLGHLRLGNLLLDGRQARVWRPRPANRGGAASAHTLAAIAARATTRLAPACRRLAGALAASDPEGVCAFAAVLVGSGPGLTPSGDDAIVGLLAVLHRAGSRDTSAGPLRLLRASLNSLLGRTTAISAHYLRLAIDGHFGEHLTNLVDTLGADGGASRDHLARVRATGASSGADALAGVVAGLRLLQDLRPSHQVKETETA